MLPNSINIYRIRYLRQSFNWLTLCTNLWYLSIIHNIHFIRWYIYNVVLQLSTFLSLTLTIHLLVAVDSATWLFWPLDFTISIGIHSGVVNYHQRTQRSFITHHLQSLITFSHRPLRPLKGFFFKQLRDLK